MIVVAGHMICHMICSHYPTTRTRPPSSGPRYVAIYDYTAADDDEISFQEGQYGIETHYMLNDLLNFQFFQVII